MNLCDMPPGLLTAEVSLRDHIAAGALRSLLSTVTGYHTPDRRAAFAYQVANAMLKQRGAAEATLSLRDHFAILALNGLVVARSHVSPEWLAGLAYREADALLQARETTPRN